MKSNHTYIFGLYDCEGHIYCTRMPEQEAFASLATTLKAPEQSSTSSLIHHQSQTRKGACLEVCNHGAQTTVRTPFQASAVYSPLLSSSHDTDAVHCKNTNTTHCTHITS